MSLNFIDRKKRLTNKELEEIKSKKGENRRNRGSGDHRGSRGMLGKERSRDQRRG